MKQLKLFSFVFLFSLNSFAQISFDVGYHVTGVTGVSDFDTINSTELAFPISSQSTREIYFKLGWHQRINDFLELDAGFDYSDGSYLIKYGGGLSTTEFSYGNYFRRLGLSVNLNGLIPISEKGTWIFSTGITPQFTLYTSDGIGFTWFVHPLGYTIYNVNYNSWIFNYQLGTAYRHQIGKKHQLEIGLRYQRALNHFAGNGRNTYPSYYHAQFKHYNAGLQVGYIYSFK